MFSALSQLADEYWDYWDYSPFTRLLTQFWSANISIKSMFQKSAQNFTSNCEMSKTRQFRLGLGKSGNKNSQWKPKGVKRKKDNRSRMPEKPKYQSCHFTSVEFLEWNIRKKIAFYQIGDVCRRNCTNGDCTGKGKRSNFISL